jgi:ATP-dependent exoDNAse (exonuclease V) beta subunit
VELRKNYRSDPGLIRFYNDLFRRVMGDAEEDFEARFEPLEARSEQSDLAPRISIFYKPYNAEAPEGILSQDDAEAYHIARYVRNVVEEQLLQVPSGDATRPVTYGDIALLMRSTSNQIRYERMLRLFGVPYTTQSVRSLFLEAPLNDMYSLLQLVVYPTDRVAYAALLRSPFVQLSDDSLLSVLLREQEPFAACELPDEDAGKYAQGAELYRWCRERADRWSNAELVSGLWFEWGYRFVLLRDPAYHGYLEYYDYFKRLAERADARGRALAAFLDELRPNLGRYERLPDLEVVQDRSEGVQLLTIHKSKGLEFPVVILANTGNVGARDNQGSAPYYRSSEYGVTLNVSSTHATKRRRQNYFYRVGKSEAERREHAELKRLLYVALTRAESHLVISGCHHRTNQRAEGALLNMVRDALGEDFGVQRAETPVVVKEIPDVPEDAQYKSPVRRLRVSSAAASAAYHEAPVKRREARSVEISPTELNERHLMQVELGAGELLPALAADAAIEGDDLEAAFGTLCHLVIQQELGGGFLEGLMPPGLERRIPERVRGRLVADAVGLARAFLDSPFFASLESGERAGELPFVFRLSTPEASTVRYFVNGTIDLLIEFATSVHVVDFKTDRFLRIGEYDAQLEVYRRAAEALTGKPARATLYYLRAGRPVDVEGGYPLQRLVDPP